MIGLVVALIFSLACAVAAGCWARERQPVGAAVAAWASMLFLLLAFAVVILSAPA